MFLTICIQYAHIMTMYINNIGMRSCVSLDVRCRTNKTNKFKAKLLTLTE